LIIAASREVLSGCLEVLNCLGGSWGLEVLNLWCLDIRIGLGCWSLNIGGSCLFLNSGGGCWSNIASSHKWLLLDVLGGVDWLLDHSLSSGNWSNVALSHNWLGLDNLLLDWLVNNLALDSLVFSALLDSFLWNVLNDSLFLLNVVYNLFLDDLWNVLSYVLNSVVVSDFLFSRDVLGLL